jgi:hypothetical protein
MQVLDGGSNFRKIHSLHYFIFDDETYKPPSVDKCGDKKPIVHYWRMNEVQGNELLTRRISSTIEAERKKGKVMIYTPTLMDFQTLGYYFFTRTELMDCSLMDALLHKDSLRYNFISEKREDYVAPFSAML